MSVEDWKSFFDIGALALVLLTFAFGVGVLVTGNIINNRQAEQLRAFDKNLTEAKTELGRQQERAGKADERAGLIESANLKLRTDLENATTESTVRQTELEIQQRKTAEAQKALIDSQIVLKQHIDDVAKPRHILGTGSNILGDRKKRQERFYELKKFSGTRTIQPGVRMVTLEDSPFRYGNLGPEAGRSGFGVLPGTELKDEHNRVLTKYGFEFPEGAVVILVGPKPANEWWPSSFFPKGDAKP